MMNRVKIVNFDENIEELVDVCLDGKIITCYAQYSNHILEKNSFWNAKFYGENFHEIIIKKEEYGRCNGLYRLGNNFAYDAVGYLNEGQLNCGDVVFEEDFLLSDFYYLNGQIVYWRIERLEIDFVEKISA